jgi:hypothetical protein
MMIGQDQGTTFRQKDSRPSENGRLIDNLFAILQMLSPVIDMESR